MAEPWTYTETCRLSKCKGRRLHFEQIGGIRVAQNGLYHTYCPSCGKYRHVAKAPHQTGEGE